MQAQCLLASLSGDGAQPETVVAPSWFRAWSPQALDG